MASVEKENEMNMQRDIGHMSLRRNRGNNVQSPCPHNQLLVSRLLHWSFETHNLTRTGEMAHLIKLFLLLGKILRHIFPNARFLGPP